MPLKKVLIIDDDADTNDLLAVILDEAGFEVIQVRKSETMAEVTRLGPDLILLDHVLNGESGGDMCRKLKKYPSTRRIPVILMSALANISEVASNSCADAYISKPFNIWEIEEMVKKMLPDDRGHSSV